MNGSLRIVSSDQSSTFEELPQIDNTFSIHHKNIQSLAIETYKFVNVLSTGNNEQCISFKGKQPIHSEKCI